MRFERMSWNDPVLTVQLGGKGALMMAYVCPPTTAGPSPHPSASGLLFGEKQLLQPAPVAQGLDTTCRREAQQRQIDKPSLSIFEARYARAGLPAKSS
jgi:hypothetical protein